MSSNINEQGGRGGLKLNTDICQIERMEVDLRYKVGQALAAANIQNAVHGVFSIDDLEGKLESELCQKIGIGVGYVRAEPTALTSEPKGHLNVDSGVATKTLDFIFMVIMAVPVNLQCDERHNATQVLTALRFGILGSCVAEDKTQRGWAFVREGPEIDQSTDTLLFYSQVWRLAMQNVGSSR